MATVTSAGRRVPRVLMLLAFAGVLAVVHGVLGVVVLALLMERSGPTPSGPDMPRYERTKLAGYGAATCSAVYGGMKLGRALGDTTLADKARLPPKRRDRLRPRDPLLASATDAAVLAPLVTSHWVQAAAALLGMAVAPATVTAPRASLDRARDGRGTRARWGLTCVGLES